MVAPDAETVATQDEASLSTNEVEVNKHSEQFKLLALCVRDRAQTNWLLANLKSNKHLSNKRSATGRSNFMAQETVDWVKSMEGYPISRAVLKTKILEGYKRIGIVDKVDLQKLSFIDTLSDSEFKDWTSELASKWHSSNDPYIEVVDEVLRTFKIPSFSIGTLEENQLKAIEELQEKFAKCYSASSVTEIMDTMRANPILFEIAFRAHIDWRNEIAHFSVGENAEKQEFLYDPNFKLENIDELYSEDLIRKIVDEIEVVAGSSPENLKLFITETRNKFNVNPNNSTPASFSLMYAIVNKLEELSRKDNSPTQIKDALGAMLYEIQADFNPAIVEAIIDGDTLLKGKQPKPGTSFIHLESI